MLYYTNSLPALPLFLSLSPSPLSYPPSPLPLSLPPLSPIPPLSLSPSGENKTQSATKCLLKIATMASQEDDFTKAGEIFESVGKGSMETK